MFDKMASIKVRRLRFYLLLIVIFMFLAWFLWLKPTTPSINDTYSIQLQAKQTIVDEIKITA